MSLETRSTSALFKRAEQLKRWEESDTNRQPVSPKQKSRKIKFSSGCVFLAACAAGDKDEVLKLLEKGADIDTANVDGLTALHQACIDDNLDMVEFLVENGADVNRGDNEGWTPLHATASCGFLSIAKYLIEKGADVAAVNNDGELALDIAECQKMEDLLREEIEERGIDCDAARHDEELIMLRDARDWLAAKSSLVNEPHPKNGATALHVAAAKGYMDVLKILIQCGADIDAQDVDGWTPLHAAAHWGQKEACQFLAEKLADMEAKNYVGQSAFDLCDTDMLSYLEDLRKKQNKEDVFNRRMAIKIPDICDRNLEAETPSNVKKVESVNEIEPKVNENTEKKNKLNTGSPIVETTNPSLVLTQKIVDDPEDNLSWKKPSREIGELTSPVKSSVSNNLTNSLDVAKETEVTLRKIPSSPNDKMSSKEENSETKSVSVNITAATNTSPEKTSPVTSPQPTSQQPFRRSFVPPVRDEESETQRKAHAKRVRETRRSTQGVTLEEIKSASKSAEQSVKKQSSPTSNNSNEKFKLEDATKPADMPSTPSFIRRTNTTNPVQRPSSAPLETADTTTVTLPLRKPRSIVEKDQDKENDIRNATLATQAAINRRRRPKRRSTGVVTFDNNDDLDQEKDPTCGKDCDENIKSNHFESGTDRSSRSRIGSTSDIRNENGEIDYKKLYEQQLAENERLKDKLRKSDEELRDTKQTLEKINLVTSKNSLSELEKRERRAMERKLSEMEEELKNLDNLRTENQRLKDENGALIRVISKLSK